MEPTTSIYRFEFVWILRTHKLLIYTIVIIIGSSHASQQSQNHIPTLSRIGNSFLFFYLNLLVHGLLRRLGLLLLLLLRLFNFVVLMLISSVVLQARHDVSVVWSFPYLNYFLLNILQIVELQALVGQGSEDRVKGEGSPDPREEADECNRLTNQSSAKEVPLTKNAIICLSRSYPSAKNVTYRILARNCSCMTMKYFEKLSTSSNCREWILVKMSACLEALT